MGLISRQAAISLPVKPREDRYFQTQSLDDAYDYGWRSLQRCIEKLPSAQTEQRWIPCIERLPEENGLYLVTTSKGQVQVHVFNYNGNSEEYWMRCNKAWMPMPEPWEGDAK